MKKVILLTLIFLLIIPSVVSGIGAVEVIPTPHFIKELFIITTDGDGVWYSFTITNIGNETIKDQKLWYDLIPPSEKSGRYNLSALDIPELKPGDNITLQQQDPPFLLKEVGLYKLKFAINSQGDKNLSSVTVHSRGEVRGKVDTLNVVYHDFHAFDRNWFVVVTYSTIVGSFILLVVAILKLVKRKK